LKAGVIAILGSANRALTLQDLARGLASDDQTLRTRKLIARAAQRGPRREKHWRTTPLFLETFKLDSLDDLYKDEALQKLFPSVYSSAIDEDEVQTEVQEPPPAS
jgi:hypothetical protein